MKPALVIFYRTGWRRIVGSVTRSLLNSISIAGKAAVLLTLNGVMFCIRIVAVREAVFVVCNFDVSLQGNLEHLKSYWACLFVNQSICGHWGASSQSFFLAGLYIREAANMIRFVILCRRKDCRHCKCSRLLRRHIDFSNK